jgi:hypothetical protein
MESLKEKNQDLVIRRVMKFHMMRMIITIQKMKPIKIKKII